MCFLAQMAPKIICCNISDQSLYHLLKDQTLYVLCKKSQGHGYSFPNACVNINRTKKCPILYRWLRCVCYIVGDLSGLCFELSTSCVFYEEHSRRRWLCYFFFSFSFSTLIGFQESGPLSIVCYKASMWTL